MTDQDEYQSPEPLRTYDAKIYIRDRKKCLERGCRNLETRCKDCGRLVCDKTLPPFLDCKCNDKKIICKCCSNLYQVNLSYHVCDECYPKCVSKKPIIAKPK